MHYRMLVISERLCCCMDSATGSMLTGIYTLFVSLAFMAIGIDSIVETSKEPHNSEDLAALNAVFGLVIVVSILFGVASVSLVLGAARKYKTYLILWMVISPLWTILAFCQLILLPIYVTNATTLTNLTSRVCATVFILLTNFFCMFCVYVFFASLCKSPMTNLRSLGVVEALESGFSSGYSRLRESIRPKSKSAAMFKNKPVTDPVSLPEVSVSVVLDPNKLESHRSSAQRSSRTLASSDGGDKPGADVSASAADHPSGAQSGGFVNVGFATDI